MKGLLLKDWYLTKKYCKSYLFLFALFIGASVWGDDTFFFIYYPCLLSGMIPVTLLSYDEQSKWSQYCGALPYTKAQIVSGKYLVGLIAQLAVIALAAIAQGVRTCISGGFDGQSYVMLLVLLLTMSCFSGSISLPFMFKCGVEKGRIAYYIMIGVICAASVVGSRAFEKMGITRFSPSKVLLTLCLAAFAFYALSWYLSIVFYRKREA